MVTKIKVIDADKNKKLKHTTKNELKLLSLI